MKLAGREGPTESGKLAPSRQDLKCPGTATIRRAVFTRNDCQRPEVLRIQAGTAQLPELKAIRIFTRACGGSKQCLIY